MCAGGLLCSLNHLQLFTWTNYTQKWPEDPGAPLWAQPVTSTALELQSRAQPSPTHEPEQQMNRRNMEGCCSIQTDFTLPNLNMTWEASNVTSSQIWLHSEPFSPSAIFPGYTLCSRKERQPQQTELVLLVVSVFYWKWLTKDWTIPI